jgi:large subunit ribosomal protein L35
LPKIKTHKTAAKRFKVTARGKVMRMKIGRSHLRRRKPHRVLRQLDKMIPAAEVDAKRVKKLVPYLE